MLRIMIPYKNKNLKYQIGEKVNNYIFGNVKKSFGYLAHGISPARSFKLQHIRNYHNVL